MPPDSARGFTLIEMIVVLAILGLVGGLVMVRGPQRSGAADMRQAATMVTGALRNARGRAIVSNRPVPVRLDAATRTVQLGDDSAQKLPTGIALVAGTKLILFRPDGSSSGGEIDLSGAARTARIGVNWLTGRVAVEAPK